MLEKHNELVVWISRFALALYDIFTMTRDIGSYNRKRSTLQTATCTIQTRERIHYIKHKTFSTSVTIFFRMNKDSIVLLSKNTPIGSIARSPSAVHAGVCSTQTFASPYREGETADHALSRNNSKNENKPSLLSREREKKQECSFLPVLL